MIHILIAFTILHIIINSTAGNAQRVVIDKKKIIHENAFRSTCDEVAGQGPSCTINPEQQQQLGYHPELKFVQKPGMFVFLETFQQSSHVLSDQSHSGWIKSAAAKYKDQSWAHGTVMNKKPPGIDGDKSIVVAVKQKHYAISKMFSETLDNTGKDLVIQYEVRFHAGVSCSGAYLKLIGASSENAFNPLELSDQTPYVVMFGPDVCGALNTKVQLIFRVKNPISNKWEQKHLLKHVPVELDFLSHLYTLELRSNGDFRILVDLIVKASGSLYDEKIFRTPFQPPKEVEDVNATKPVDWVDDEYIPDPKLKKPDDWDENEPKFIQDPNDAMPRGWNEHEPLKVPDPDAAKPEGWIEEEDGKWEPPMIKNPKCSIGCGKYVPRMISNPLYKGKWNPPKVPNPNYKGQWKPGMIPNPNYFENKRPSDLPPMSAVAIEILVNENGVGFDNIAIGHDIPAARHLAEETFLVKKFAERELDRRFYELERERELLEEYEESPYGMLQYYSHRTGQTITVNLIPFTMLFLVAFVAMLKSIISYELAVRRPGGKRAIAEDDYVYHALR